MNLDHEMKEGVASIIAAPLKLIGLLCKKIVIFDNNHAKFDIKNYKNILKV
jgi:hypothetical protein